MSSLPLPWNIYISRSRIAVASTCFIVASILVLLFQDGFLIDGQRLGSDAAQNLRSAMNVAVHNVYSEKDVSPFVEPGYRREPLPNYFLGLILRLVHRLMPNWLNLEGGEFDPNLLIFAKSLNLFYTALLFLGLWFLLLMLVRPLWLANLASFFVIQSTNLFFVKHQVNNLNTELIASTTLIWLTVLILQAKKRSSLQLLCCAGLIIGSLALIKATTAYLSLIILPLFAVLFSGIKKNFLLSFVTIGLGFCLAVTPWLIRNSHNFNNATIAQGAGDILLIRHAFNEMTNEQVVDSFYAYSPKLLRKSGLIGWKKYDENDFECGHKLQVFNRNLSCDKIALDQERYSEVRSLYQRGKRALPRLLHLSSEQKRTYALNQLLANPTPHLVVTAPMAWRGLWSFRINDWYGLLINAAAYLSLLSAPLIGLYKHQRFWIFISAFPISFYLFYALTSHFLPRYSAPLIPSALLCLSLVFVEAVSKMSTFFGLKDAGKIRFRQDYC